MPAFPLRIPRATANLFRTYNVFTLPTVAMPFGNEGDDDYAPTEHTQESVGSKRSLTHLQLNPTKRRRTEVSAPSMSGSQSLARGSQSGFRTPFATNHCASRSVPPHIVSPPTYSNAPSTSSSIPTPSSEPVGSEAASYAAPYSSRPAYPTPGSQNGLRTPFATDQRSPR